MTTLVLTVDDARSDISFHCTAWLRLTMSLHNANAVYTSFHCIAWLLLTVFLQLLMLLLYGGCQEC